MLWLTSSRLPDNKRSSLQLRGSGLLSSRTSLFQPLARENQAATMASKAPSFEKHPGRMLDIVGPCLSRHAQLRATTPMLGLTCGSAPFPDGLHGFFLSSSSAGLEE